MSRYLVLYFFTQSLCILKVSSQGQAVKQYLLTRVGPQSQPGLTKIPAFNPINQPNIPNVSPGQYFIPGPTLTVPASQYLPTGPQMSPTPQFLPTGVNPITSTTQFISSGAPNSVLTPVPPVPCQKQGIPQSALPPPLKSLIPSNLPTPPIPTPTSPMELQTSKSAVMDTHVLNNLAIALQLLIVNNILNKPLPEPTAGAKSPFEALQSIVPYPPDPPSEPRLFSPYYPKEYGSVSYNQFTPMPNANFLGGSNLIDTSSPMFGMAGKPPTRSSMTLMSPYEALGPSSPFSDPILSSQYGSSKVDFQSPYAAILSDGNNDLFSMADLF